MGRKKRSDSLRSLGSLAAADPENEDRYGLKEENLVEEK